MSRVVSALGLLIIPLGIIGAAEYATVVNHGSSVWHVIDGLLAVVLVVCAIGIVGCQPR
jgi:hypothetical protein